jgi:hypothetical protein
MGLPLSGGISVTEWQQQQRGAAMPGQAAGQTWQQTQSHAQPYAQSQYGQQQYGQPQYQQVQPYEPHQPAAGTQGQRRTGLTGAQQFWYVLQCIAFGAGYFAKIPAKKALADFGMAELTSAERFWYVLQCIAFGAGYFAKLPTAKALSEMPQFRSTGY